MPHLIVVPDVERGGGLSLMQGVSEENIVHLADDAEIQIGALDRGMQSGAPSVAIVCKLPDDKVLFMETSLKLYLAAGDGMCAAMGGDPREGS